PQVVALHLLGGFTTLSLLTLLVLRLRKFSAVQNNAARIVPEEHRKPSMARLRLGKLRPWLYGGLLLVILQIALGAWTAANYAAVACTDLPTCQGQWWPEGMDFQHGFDITQHVGPNYLGGQLTADGRVAIHVTHRAGALVVLAYFAVLLVLIWRRSDSREMRRPVLLVAAALAAQITLGLANVVFHIPLPIAVAHNAMGAGLLLSVIVLIWQHHLLPQAHAARATHTTIMHQEITA
ncbi:MAG: COX15/CtaA family protein, partial [Oceanisphaera sp.]|nr:COX15/CtaA family protein [Oceanisphaera sp.]